MSAHSSSGGASGIGGGGMSENLDLLVDYWPLQSASTMQIPSTKEKKEVNKVGVKAGLNLSEYVENYLEKFNNIH